MRRIFAVLVLGVTALLVYFLDHPLGALPAIGRLIDPVNGCWANAEPVNKSFTLHEKVAGVQQETKIWLDSQMIPHIHAANEHDLYFTEGYVHASFRLWQMDMETRAAAGRVSEVIGMKGKTFDRRQRRKGMVFAAENSLSLMESDARTKQMMDAYTEGINAYIATLNYRCLPLEYKLMGFVPEKWTNLKIALLLKYMADDLTGGTDDMALTYLRDALPADDFKLLFPEKISGSATVIPAGTSFDKPSMAVPPAPADSLVFPRYKGDDFGGHHDDGVGSNNWAVSGSRTASGAPILCNDPHLGLNLPSLWFVAQLQCPGINVYGVSLPGTPGVVIGFNDSLGWGFTNNYRDVKDFYEIRPVAGSNDKYWFAGRQLDYKKRVEHIIIKGEPELVDTVNYTIHGPVMYDDRFKSQDGLQRPLSMCWMAHRPTNEMLAIYLMNKAGNYEEFVNAIFNFKCPAQNMAYADKKGNIAIWGQGQFVNKWKEQGRFVMEGTDSATLWKDLIPMNENPHVLNPERGFISSANECVTDDSYPYWYNGDFVELRAWRIREVLAGISKATINDMFALQNDTHSLLAQNMLPYMLSYIRNGGEYIDELKKWDYNLTAESKAATIFQTWWKILYADIWKEKFAKVPDNLLPLPERTMQLLLNDSLLPRKQYPDSVRRAEYISKLINNSFLKTADSIAKLKQDASWYKVKNTTVAHLAKLPAFSYNQLKIGGWGNTVNAAKENHGPSWRMVVQMGKETEAYGVYPGGQSGNPGSKYYADFLQSWAEGKYYRLQFLPNTREQHNNAIKYTWTIN